MAGTVSKQKKRTVAGIYTKETLGHPWLLSFTLAGIAIQSAAELTSPLYMKQFFNTLVLRAPDTALLHALFITLVVIALLYAADWAGGRVLYFSLIYLESSVAVRLYSEAFQYLIDHSYHFFSSQFSGTLTRRVSKFANAYETLFDSIMMQFLPTAIFVTGAVIILFIRNHLLGSLLGLWALIFTVFQFYAAIKQKPLREARSREDSHLTGSLADAIGNQTTISLFSGNIFERGRFADAVTSWHHATLRTWQSNELTWGMMGILVVIIEVALLFGALHYWALGELTIGDFVLIQSYLITTVQQLFGINRNLRRFYDGYEDANEMVTILNTPHGIQDAPQAQALVVTSSVIDFTDVTFTFNENRSVLADLSLHVSAKEKVALVGPSGAGKSTITRLLLRFYDVQGGSIAIDGQNIADVTQNSLREAIAFVPQEPILFHRSLMENIRYGKRDATDSEVIEAAKKAHCHEFICGFPDGYDTYVGERGVKLSGGERQRVAIARAILKNAPILVLDEATSSLDSESESLIQDALRVLMENKTVIVIAHRLSTIMKMDRIIVIEGGQIAAQGTHEELLHDTSSLYHKLWSIQAGGFLVDAGVDSAPEEPESEDKDVN